MSVDLVNIEGEIIEECPTRDVINGQDSVVSRHEVELANNVHLNLQAAGVDFTMTTQSPLSEVVELSAKVQLLTAQLKEANSRLEAAFYRIGYLEGQAAERAANK